MFVGDTFLSLFDRLSIRSTITGKTGTIIGIVFSMLFIITSILIFIGPVIYYFKGDYIQGIFHILQAQKLQMFTGCDFKLAVSFYNKATGQLMDHQRMATFLKTQVTYFSPTGKYFYLDPQPCSDQYFAEMTEKPHKFTSKDCYIVPDGLSYVSQITSNYISVFGFSFQPLCNDPFLCVYSPNTTNPSTLERMNLFTNYYYVLRFTGIYVDDAGKFKKKFYQVYSTEWEGHDILIPLMYAVLETQKVYLDNSIMPWYNNETKVVANWMGLSFGKQYSQQTIQIAGTATYLSTEVSQRVVYRQYRKLDWLIGLVAGGIFLLYLIFWIPCNFISTLKLKIYSSYSTTLVRNDSSSITQFSKPYYRLIWMLCTLLPFNLKCFKKQNKTMYQSQKFLDIADLVKKVKTASKNLKMKKYPAKFKFKRLQQQQANANSQNNNFSQEQLKYEMPGQTIQKIRTNQQIPNIYQSSLSILSIHNNGDEQSQASKKMKSIMQMQQYSRTRVPNFKQRRRTCCKKVLSTLQCIIKLFDVFGSRPNLTSNPQNISALGCLLTIVIALASILTFALTLNNMGIKRTYWDQIYQKPATQHIMSVTGKSFRAAICMHSYAFILNYVVGQDRVADFKFYQYKREGHVQTEYYYDTLRISNDADRYFDMPNQAFNTVDTTYCFRPENGIDIQVYGDGESQRQAYVGFKVIPHCSGTVSTCNSRRATLNKNFLLLLSYYPIWFYMPKATYYPEYQQVLITPSGFDLSQHIYSQILNFTSSIERTLTLDQLQIVDSYSSWLLGPYPTPSSSYLSKNIQRSHYHARSRNTTDPYYRIKIGTTGRVERVIFSSYKLDFMFAVIGGCFVFYAVAVGWLGVRYNRWKMRAKIAELLYNEDRDGLWRAIKGIFGGCCQDQVMRKVDYDIDCVRLAKRADNVYRLSAAQYTNPIQNNLALIYLKQRIKQDEQVIVKPSTDQQQSSSSDQDYHDWQDLVQKKNQPKNPNKIQNISQSEYSQQIALQKQQMQAHAQHPTESLSTPALSPLQTECCSSPSWLHRLDFFSSNPQLTLDGKRKITSIFGGCFCIAMVIFICVLVSHFITIYFQGIYWVSSNFVYERSQGEESDIGKIGLEVGKNFKLGVSFYKADDYQFYDVSNLTKDVAIKIIKYKVEKLQGSNIQTIQQQIDLQTCSQDYFDGYVDQTDKKNFFRNIQLGYCVPDGIKLNLYGSAQCQVREYFSLKIQSLQSPNKTQSLQSLSTLLSSYLPLYHITSPSLPLSPSSPISYSTLSIPKSYSYQLSTSFTSNLTITKRIISYDTAVNPSSQRPSTHSYAVKSHDRYQFSNSQIAVQQFNQLRFYGEDLVDLHTVRGIKVNQIFGIVGGCIAILVIGLGCIPRSYNHYKMRYQIGTKLYQVQGVRPKDRRDKRGRRVRRNTDDEDEREDGVYSEWRLMRAWFMSFWGFLKSDYNGNKTLRIMTLIQSRVGKDINIYQFMKTLYACEDGIKQMNLVGDPNFNICKIYPKQVVPTYNQNNKEAAKQLCEDIEDHYPDLVRATIINGFTQWELNILKKAKQANDQNQVKIDTKNIFAQRWLDKFFGEIRGPSQNASQSNIHSSNNINPSQGGTQAIGSQSMLGSNMGKKQKAQIKRSINDEKELQLQPKQQQKKSKPKKQKKEQKQFAPNASQMKINKNQEQIGHSNPSQFEYLPD